MILWPCGDNGCTLWQSKKAFSDVVNFDRFGTLMNTHQLDIDKLNNGKADISERVNSPYMFS